MIPEYNRKSLALGIPGILLQIGCNVGINVLAARAKIHSDMPPQTFLILALCAGALIEHDSVDYRLMLLRQRQRIQWGLGIAGSSVLSSIVVWPFCRTRTRISKLICRGAEYSSPTETGVHCYMHVLLGNTRFSGQRKRACTSGRDA